MHTLIKHDIALHVAHTNADTADPGVSDALAGALDLRVVRPLVPDATDPSGRRGLGRVCELDPPMHARRVRRPRRRAAARHRAGHPRGGRPRGDGPYASPSAAAPATASSTPYARSGADAFLTADLRHHPVSEATPAAHRSGWSTPRTGPPNGPGASRPPPSSTRFPTATAGTSGSTSRRRSPTPGPPTTPPLLLMEPPTERRARRPDPPPRRTGAGRPPVAARPQAEFAARARRDRLAHQGPHPAARPARRRADRGERHRPRADQGRAGRGPGAPARRP